MNRSGACALQCAVAGVLLAGQSLAFAAREEQLFEVSVTIPTADFFVLPTDPGFLEREQRMHWDLVRGTLEPVKTQFDVRNLRGAITARLGYEPALANEYFTIPLAVTFNNQLLGLTSAAVATEAEGVTGARVPLHIDAIPPPGGFKPGEYYGSVLIIFEPGSP